MLLRPVGHVRGGKEAQKLLVHSPEGPGATVRWPGVEPVGPGAMLIAALQGGSPAPRALAPQEVWRIQGGDAAEWERAIQQGANENLLVREAA